MSCHSSVHDEVFEDADELYADENLTSESSDFESDFECMDGEDMSEDDQKMTITEELFMFCLMFQISGRAMDFLLKLLLRHGVENIPPSYYILKKTASLKKYDIMNMRKGKFSYLSVSDNLKFCIDEGFLTSGKINLKFNFDGLPLFRSSFMNVWPILMIIENCAFRFPLPVAVYCGLGKPDVDHYLKEFTEEMTRLKQYNFFYNGVSLIIERLLFICDVPARAMIQCINLYNAYYGCGYCRQKGSYVEDRIVFEDMNFSLRDDETYKLKKENNQNKTLSPLAIIPSVGLLSSFPTD